MDRKEYGQFVANEADYARSIKDYEYVLVDNED